MDWTNGFWKGMPLATEDGAASVGRLAATVTNEKPKEVCSGKG